MLARDCAVRLKWDPEKMGPHPGLHGGGDANMRQPGLVKRAECHNLLCFWHLWIFLSQLGLGGWELSQQNCGVGLCAAWGRSGDTQIRWHTQLDYRSSMGLMSPSSRGRLRLTGGLQYRNRSEKEEGRWVEDKWAGPVSTWFREVAGWGQQMRPLLPEQSVTRVPQWTLNSTSLVLCLVPIRQ